MKHFIHAESGITVVSQLTWQVLDPLGSGFFGHTLIPSLIDGGARMSATYKNGSEVNIGITNAVFEEVKKPKRKARSFAVLVAKQKGLAGQTCIVFIQAGESAESTGLVCAMIAGDVVLDDQFELANIDSLYQNFAEMCQRSGRNFEVYGDIAPQGTQLKQALTLSELLSKSRKNTNSAVKALRSDKSLFVIVLLALICILIFMGLAAFDWYQEGIASRRQANIQQLQSPEHIYGQAVAVLLAKPTWIAPKNIQEISNAIGQFPAKIAGWNLVNLICEENDCIAKWKSTGGNYFDFQDAAYPVWGQLIFSTSTTEAHGDLKTLQHSVNLGVTGSLLPAVEQWPKFDDYLISSGVEIQKLKLFGWSHQLSLPIQQAIPPTISPISVAQHPHAIHAMPWSIAQQSWIQAKEILSIFPLSATLNRFEIHIDEKDSAVKFTATGLVYVKK